MEKTELWHTLTPEEAARRLGTDAGAGLSSDEAGARLSRYGPNALEEAKRRSPLAMFLGQFTDFMILVLLGAAVVSAFMGEAVDTAAIAVILALNAAIGFVQEMRAEKAMSSLREMSAPEAEAVRGGRAVKVRSAELVPGDVVLLAAGYVVPADVRLTEANMLRMGEAALTGESGHAEKSASDVYPADAPLGDRGNMAFKGTVVSAGRGRGIVVETGMRTEIGKIARLVQEREEKTPLQRRLAVFGRKLSYAVIFISVIVFTAGLIRGEPVLLMLMTAVSLAVAAIPEALPAVVTVSLAIGASRMAKVNALIRKLSAVEALGSVTYICTDKTGTLTKNVMAVTEVYSDGEEYRLPLSDERPRLSMLLQCMALNNDASCGMEGAASGDPTEVALLKAAADAGWDRGGLEADYPRVAEAPFEAERKLMSTVHKSPAGGYLMITKGAVEAVADMSELAQRGAATAPLDREGLRRAAAGASARGLRLLAFAVKRLDMPVRDPRVEEERGGFAFVGYAALTDPLRDEAAGAVAQCRSAGINIVLITGDHPATAARVASDAGIHDGPDVMTGAELARLPLEEFEARVERVRVYARVAPEQKYKIVQALKDRGHFVAMTGDGVNDAPALKKADIGVAMGVTGTDVAREASDMVLLDDNFATVVNAVREGRRIYDNIRKFIKYSLTSNSGELWTIFLAPFFGLPLPLTPVQILWINLVTDGLPGLSLAVEPGEKNIMARPPRPPSESVFAHGLGMHVIWVGLLMGGVSILVQAWAFTSGNPRWQSMVFTVLCLSQMGHVMAIRSERESLISQGPLSNRPLVLSVVLTVLLQLCVLYVPFLNPVFGTAPLKAGELALALGLSSVVFVAVEAEKFFIRRRPETRTPDAGTP
ncbi:MAG TPA: cation-translocating P-type ATPase [Nitrospirota bacterium]|nr:cation-translocating P-type ATPase [Nitrospirota bacterium]